MEEEDLFQTQGDSMKLSQTSVHLRLLKAVDKPSYDEALQRGEVSLCTVLKAWGIVPVLGLVITGAFIGVVVTFAPIYVFLKWGFFAGFVSLFPPFFFYLMLVGVYSSELCCHWYFAWKNKICLKIEVIP